MKQIVFFLTVLFIGTLYSQNSECENFKIGEFQNIEKGIVKAEIKRTEKFQFERFDDIEIKLKIVWINDCSYRLIFIEGNDSWWESKEKDSSSSTPDLIVRITNISGDSYLQESKFVDDDEFKYKSKVLKIK